MKIRLITTILLSAALVATMFAAVARAQSLDKNIEITEFRMDPVDTPHSYPPTQAAGNPNVSLYFRFCDQGLLVTNVVRTSTPPDPDKFVVTTATPHGMNASFNFVKIRGVRSVAGANGTR